MRITIEGVDRSASYQPSELEAISIEMMAHEGEVGIGQVPLPDDAGTLEPYAGQQFKLDVGGTVIVDGFVGAMNRDRNGIVGGSRLVQHHNVTDDNALLNGYRAVGWRRGPEYDDERMQAFVDDFLAHLSLDTTWLLSTHHVMLPAKTYTTEALFSELQDDCGKPTGKIMFIERRRFHWHLPTEGIVSDIAIVASGADYADTFINMSDTPPIRSKDPMDLAVDVLAMNSRGQTAPAIDSTAQSRHDASGIRHQILVQEPDASLALLATIAANTLAERKAERITYEGEIGPMTAAQVERIPVGCLINVTDAVWGLSSSTQRIASETIRYVHPDSFMVKVELGYPIRVRAKPPVTTPPVPVLEPFVCEPTDFTVLTNLADPQTFAIINNGVDDTTRIGDPADGYVILKGNCTYRFDYTVYHSPLSTLTEAHVYVVGAPGGADPFDARAYMGTEGIDAIAFATRTWTTDPGPDIHVVAWISCNPPGGGEDNEPSSVAMTVTYLGGADPRFDTLPRCSNGEPAPNQRVQDPPTLGDGTTTSFTTDGSQAYRPGSLELWVNGLDWTDQLTETDPTTGAYDVAYPIPLGAVTFLRYRAP